MTAAEQTAKDEGGSAAGAAPIAPVQEKPTATSWHWSEHGTLVTADGYIVLTGKAHLRVLDNGSTLADATVWIDPQWKSLVAAAPDLLAALKELVADTECYCLGGAEGRAKGACAYCAGANAIAKAEGR